MFKTNLKTEKKFSEYKAVLFEEPRKCPTCGIEPFGENTDFCCPICGKGFCTCCYELDDTCRDENIICPNCKKKLLVRF